MDLTVSLLGSRNLSASALVARSLYSILQVGTTAVQGNPIEIQDAQFTGASTASDLVIIMKNSQIQTVMYLRNVPLRLVAESNLRSVELWLELYPPGDARNSAFDESSPRPDVPQVRISMRVSSGLVGSPMHSALDNSFPSSAAPAEISRTLEQMKDIKVKVTAMTDGKRQVESAEYQLQLVQKELEEARNSIEQAELELYRLKNARSAAEQEKQEALENCGRAREALRQHEQSIMELRRSCEESERKLAQVFIDCTHQQENLDMSVANFDREMKAMAEELQHWQSQAETLTSSLEKCEQRVQQLQGAQGGAELDHTTACSQFDDEDMKMLSTNLDKTMNELMTAKAGVNEQASRLDNAERDCQSAAAKLADAEAAAASAEAAAASARDASRQKAMELRTQADDAERELITLMSRVAALEGQVGENRNQLKEMTEHVEQLVGRVHSSTDCLRDTGTAVVNLKKNFQTHELDITKKAVDAELQDVDSQLAALRKRQEELRQEVARATAEAEACEDEERQVSRLAEEEMQSAEAATDKRERKRLELVSELSAKEGELVEARQRFCEVDELAATTVANNATMQAEVEHKVLSLEEAVENMRLQLEQNRKEADELEANKRSSTSQLEETTSLLPLRKAEAQRLRQQRIQVQQEHEQLLLALAEVREQAGEQESQEEVLSKLVSEQREQLDVVKEETKAVERREGELKESLEATLVARREHGKTQSALADAEGQRRGTASRLETVKQRRSHLASEIAALQEACNHAEGQLQEVQSHGAHAEGAHKEKLSELEADCKQQHAEEAEINREGEELEEQGKLQEMELEKELSNVSSMDSTLNTRRAEVASVQQEIRLCDEELEARRQSLPARSEALSELSATTTSLECRMQTLRSEFASAEIAEEKAAELRKECDMVAAFVERTRTLDTTDVQRTNSQGCLAEKNAELDRQIERLDELESDILALAGKVEDRVVLNTHLEEQLGSTDKELLEAMEHSADQRARYGILREDIIRISEHIHTVHGQQMESLEDSCGMEDLAADERKVDLLREQLTFRTDAITRARAERQDIKSSVNMLEGELRQLTDQQGALADKLLYQVELGGLQSTTIERLQEEVHTLEAEAEVLTLGLHDAEQRNEFLQKENQLMRQQLEGIYDGSLHEWVAEVKRLKGDVEVQRNKDELSHWMQVAVEAERELKSDMDGLRLKHEEAESALREVLRSLETELAKLQDLLKESGMNKDQRSGGAVHSVPAALHGFVQPVRPTPPQVKRRALLIACNYSRSHMPLRGCANDAWNLQCLLRHSLRYSDDQVRLLIDGSESCPAPERRQPTRANILSGLKWITSDMGPGDTLFIYFAGYGTQQPRAGSPGSCEAHFVPADFAEDLPKDFFSRRGEQMRSGCYRLVPWAEVTRALLMLPLGCKVTVLLDCCFALPPGLDAKRPGPLAFPRLALDEAGAEDARQELPCSRARLLDLPPLPHPPSPPIPGTMACRCHCYCACQSEQWCVELLIEGCVQGAFTWAFVKSLTAGHMDTNVQRHCKALDRIIADLQMKFAWLDQTPVLQLSSQAKQEDLVLVPEVQMQVPTRM